VGCHFFGGLNSISHFKAQDSSGGRSIKSVAHFIRLDIRLLIVQILAEVTHELRLLKQDESLVFGCINFHGIQVSLSCVNNIDETKWSLWGSSSFSLEHGQVLN
jgi:hypothetical protein